MIGRLFVCVVVLALVGCGPDNKLGRLPISGQVTLAGEPLDSGLIQFMPENRQGVTAGASIENGTYSIPAHQGLVPNTYVVRLYAVDQQAEAVEPQLPGPGVKTQPERIPPEYNIRSKLRLELTPEGPATFDVTVP